MFVFDKENENSKPDPELEKFLKEYENKATKFYSSNYLGHMNFDISKPHYDSFIGTLKYN